MTKIKIGMEVEASETTSYTATPEFKEALREIEENMDWWNCDAMGTNQGSEFRRLPVKFRIPNHWSKETDGSCGMENKFNQPANSIEEAEERVDNLVSWFDNVGISQFRNAGTHVHLGVFDWISKNIDSVDSVLGARARRLLYGYFLTREKALFELVPPSRRGNQYCERGISTSSYGRSIDIGYATVDDKTPAWAIHNALVANSSRLQIGGAIMNSRHHPTFEFRMFPGCGSATALKGYVRLVWAMFDNVAPLLLESRALASKSEGNKVFVTNPHSFTAKDLKSELSDSWLKTWIDETLDNDGKPISTNITSSGEPQRLATV